MKRSAQMKRTEAILAACMAISLAGCALRGTPKTAAAVPPAPKPVASAPPAPPPPPPLSVPQTNVELPKPQPLDPEALITAPQPEPVPETSTATRSTRRQNTPGPGPVSNSPPRTETPPAPPQPEPERPPIQEIVPASEQKRLEESVKSRKAEINRILDQTKSRRLGVLQQGMVRTIRSLVGLADEAEKHGDFRQADANAERALILARELQSGK
jgi:hypothetical protein